MSKQKPEYYVNPEEFKEAIRVYYKDDDCTDYLGNCINKIANNLSFSPCFISYTYKDEMIGDAVLKMYSALKRHKFNVDSDSSPFSYFTTIAFHAFINRIKKEKKHHQTIVDYREKVYEESMLDAENGGYVYVKPTVDDIDGENLD